MLQKNILLIFFVSFGRMALNEISNSIGVKGYTCRIFHLEVKNNTYTNKRKLVKLLFLPVRYHNSTDLSHHYTFKQACIWSKNDINKKYLNYTNNHQQKNGPELSNTIVHLQHLVDVS